MFVRTNKTVRHSIITDDDIALDVIQNENWQYFIETILKTCQLTMEE